jgi:hypothetical protein
MNAKQIQNRLFFDFGSSSELMIPNYTPRRWFECDLFRVTKAGFSEEYEIKMSIADFRVDAKKGPTKHERMRMAAYSAEDQKRLNFEFRSKHERLAQGDQRGPVRFFFVVPEELEAKVKAELPEWAGLLVAYEWRDGVYIRKAMKARNLHKVKVSSDLIAAAKSVFYFRYWNLRRGMKEETEVAE